MSSSIRDSLKDHEHQAEYNKDFALLGAKIAPNLPKARPAPGGPFTNEQWSRLLEKTIKSITSLASIKGGEYSGDLDRLKNFRDGGRDIGLPIEKILWVYANKHWDSITTYVKEIDSTLNGRPRSEPISGRADDLIVYLILFKAMLEERGEK